MGQAKKQGSATQSVSRRGLLRVAAGAVAVGAAMRPRRASAQEKFTLKFQSGFPPKEPFHLIGADWAKKVDRDVGGPLED
jgi:TRAP-type C4-dicarboxylate transport system substrate-binding protein